MILLAPLLSWWLLSLLSVLVPWTSFVAFAGFFYGPKFSYPTSLFLNIGTNGPSRALNELFCSVSNLY